MGLGAMSLIDGESVGGEKFIDAIQDNNAERLILLISIHQRNHHGKIMERPTSNVFFNAEEYGNRLAQPFISRYPSKTSRFLVS